MSDATSNSTSSNGSEMNSYDLVVIGGSAGGLSVAISSLRSGLSLVRIVEPSGSVVFPGLVAENQLDVGLGETVRDAAQDAYAAVDKIDWEDVYFRRDIGHRAIARERT